MENEGFRYHPEYLVLGFYKIDLIGNVKSGLFTIQHDSLTIKNKEYIPGVNIQNWIYQYRIFKFLGENSYLYTVAFNSVWGFYRGRLTKEAKRDFQIEYAIPAEEITSEMKKLSLALIKRLYRFCKT